MQILIEIPDIVKTRCDGGGILQTIDIIKLKNAVAHGTPLPEHHGRLIDADALLRNTILNPCHAPYIVKLDVDEAETIIPATKEEKQIKKCCFTCKWDYSNFKEYADEATKLARCRNCKLASGYEPMKEGDGE